MEKIMFKDFPETGCVETYALLKNAEEKEARNGSIYLNVTFFDGKQELKANMWNVMKSTFGFDEYNVVTAVTFDVSVYNGKPSYTVKKIRGLDDSDEVEISEFIATSPIAPEELYDRCIEIAYTISDPDLMQVVTAIYEENKDKLLTWGAAKSMHHNIKGGLLWHSYRMAKNVDRICETYTAVNRDMAVAGTLLHDIGKLDELLTDEFGASEYTMEGSLFGHLFIGANMVQNKCRELGVEESKMVQLSHIVVSHHGEQEMGAIALPATPEAMLVHFVDNIDAKMYVFEKCLEDLQPGECSDYQLMLNRAKVYKF